MPNVKPTIVAHRGLHQSHVENTLPALQAAWKAGITWCEIDVRGSAEHQPFLLHDETLDRTTRGVGMIADTPAAVLKKVGVFSLTEVIHAMPAGASLLIEIKPRADADAIRRTLELCNPKTCTVQSFDASILHQAAEMRGEVRLELLVDDAKSPAAAESGPWKSVNANFKSLDSATVKSLRDRRMNVGAWTVNEPADIERIITLKVDTIISDEPLRVMKLLSGAKIG
jgi:glycerophosphoryl diester phosphodiesterase